MTTDRTQIALRLRELTHVLGEALGRRRAGRIDLDRARGAVASLRHLERQIANGETPRTMLQDRAEDLRDRAAKLSGQLADFAAQLGGAT